MVEIRRQLVHASGVVFIALAWFLGGFVVSAYCFLIAFTFLMYSEYVKRMEKRLEKLMHRMEGKLRDFAGGFDRSNVSRPFIGAFWFYLAFALAFLIFPLRIASAACLILAVGDALSTLAGNALGRHKIGVKSLEGSLAFFVSSLLAALIFVPLALALVGALVGALAELSSELKGLKKLDERGILDDNLLIPIVSGAVMWAVFVLL